MIFLKVMYVKFSVLFFPVEFFKLFTPVHLSQIIGGNNKAYLYLSCEEYKM